MKLQQFINYPGLSTQRMRHQKFEQQKTNLQYPYTFKNPSCLIGIEIEVENIQDSIAEYLQYYWEETEDHSLRNYGREYRSIPLRAAQIPYALEYLKTTLDNTNPDYQFSNRCSVHIHLNVRDFTMEQLACFVILYSIYEKHFFHIAGTKRENNIFCVPLWKTNHLPPKDGLIDPIYYKEWHKYLALNCGSVFGSEHNKCFGTIEFRHLYGTLDHNILYPWINSIIALREASIRYKLDDLLLELDTANTTSNYLSWYCDIFGELRIPSQILTKNNYEFCISNTKLNLYMRHNIQCIRYFTGFDSHWFKTEKNPTVKKPEITKKQKVTMDINELLDFIAGHPNIHATPAPQPLEQGWPNNPAVPPDTLIDSESVADFMNNQTFNLNF